MSPKQFALGSLLLAVVLYGLPGSALAQHGTSYIEHHHSSTVEESVLYGTGFLLRNFGAGLRDMAEGQKALAEAQSRYLENWRTSVGYRLEVQQLVAARRAANRPRPATFEQMTRWARATAPRPLSRGDLSSEGAVSWPLALLEDHYDSGRSSFERTMQQLALETNPARVNQHRRALADCCDGLKTDLKARLKDYSMADYLEASKFLDSLRVEAQRQKSPATRETFVMR